VQLVVTGEQLRVVSKREMGRERRERERERETLVPVVYQPRNSRCLYTVV
jgi:hypothetical protein